MTSTLHQIFESRADRAGLAADTDAVLDEVRARAARRSRRQRNLTAGGTGVVLVAALAVGVAVLRPGDEPGPSRTPVPAGGNVTQPETTTTPSGLKPIAPAPASAEVSIGLAPAGWVLLGARGPVTLYGPPSLVGSSVNSFDGKLLVNVSERYETSEPHPLTIAGRPATYFDRTTHDSYQGVEVVVDAKTVVGIQLPDSLTLTRAEVLRLANTLDIRNTSEKTHG